MTRKHLAQCGGDSRLGGKWLYRILLVMHVISGHFERLGTPAQSSAADEVGDELPGEDRSPQHPVDISHVGPDVHVLAGGTR